jgi:hypothetical protein
MRVTRPRPSPSLTRAWSALAVLLFALVLGLASAPAYAQSCGGCVGPGVGAGGGVQRTWLGKGAATLRFSYEYDVEDRSFKGHGTVENDFDETLRTNRLSAALRYGLTDQWTAELGLHDPRFQYRVKPPGGERSETIFRGPGDTTLLFGRRFALTDETPVATAPLTSVLDLPQSAWTEQFRTVAGPSLQVWVGTSIPTGKEEEPNRTVVRRDISVSNLQTGTGTFDPMLRVRYDDPRGDVKPFAQLDVRWPVYENRFDYASGRSLTVTAGAETDLAPKLRGNLAFSFQRSERDRFDGDRVGVGGAKWIYVTPGVAYDLTDTVTLDAAVRYTAWRDTQTKLSDGPIALQVGVTFRF